MSKDFSKHNLYIAKQALIHFFHYNYPTDEELLYDFCGLDSFNILKLKYQLLRKENNDILVASVMAEATDEEHNFLYDKYFLQRSFISLGIKFHVHPNGLQKWRDKFLTDIASLLEFNLPKSDIFSRNKVECLVFVLKRNIIFQEHYHMFDDDFICEIKTKLNFYMDFLTAINHFIYFNAVDVGSNVIKLKILHPHLSLEELSDVANCSRSTAYNYINLFHNIFFPQNEYASDN